ncbi:RND superfamily putative drug exporter [Melghiribacillus thermohalophilus]|uniref:RND superfamily putative drug exporter n=1 Tax=Melghiribacillus thermohalophilus TaxID=1324956 RepID=A0A4R3MTJ5_9BACI|nr:MMPL family transporter [Melghiribacillus thermohalophilus]TCT19345.1 RND superfamily putative drug exporter [Melghiribacillus thermohalophilus]
MKSLLNKLTDRVSTKKGMWVTLAVWLIVTMLLAVFAPNAKDYEVSTVNFLPDDAKSMIAQEKLDEYFPANEGTPAVLVFQSNEGEIETPKLVEVLDSIRAADVPGVEELIPLSTLPPQAQASFFSEDKETAALPLTFAPGLETAELRDSKEQIEAIVEEESNLQLYMTGPAGIAVDSLDLFSRADLVLLFSTIGIILVLLIVIYRSPLLALIPLIAAAFVYEVSIQLLGILGKAGLTLSNQTISIGSILLFAAVTDYSLFVFSRFREELKHDEDKFEAMKAAMRETGVPVFFSGGTVLAAMLVLFFAKSGDYQNFAPTFATIMAVVMLASITFTPALFTLFGRKSFWPRIPRVGDEAAKKNSFWSRVGRFVVKKPGLSVTAIILLLLVSAGNMVNLQYEYDTIKSFPEDMPSRQGYEILGEKFAKGDLAPTTVLFEGEEALSPDQQENLRNALADQPLVSSVQINDVTDDGNVINYSLTFEENPYEIETIDTLEKIIADHDEILEEGNVTGELYFAGETAKKVEERTLNNRDVIVIVLLETILIFLMLIVLTKSVKMPIYMMGTILVSFLAALGLGIFLTDLFFDIGTISPRVPLYAFVFLVALGIDYNIILVSRFQEERRKHSVKEATKRAVASTGGVISSAGIILAATFAVLMTQPIQLLFVFGFIVAVGIILDTFLIRGVLLPGFIVLLEKDKKAEAERG